MNQNDTHLYVYESFIHKEKESLAKKHSEYNKRSHKLGCWSLFFLIIFDFPSGGNDQKNVSTVSR